MKMKSPCSRDCPDRVADPTCHSTCPKYLAYRAELEADYPRRLELNNMRAVREEGYRTWEKEKHKRNKRGRK